MVTATSIRTGSSSSMPEHLTVLGNRMVFIANDGVHGAEPWVTDGTVAGTRLLADAYPGSSESGAEPLAAIGGQLVFRTYNGPHPLWITDGTSTDYLIPQTSGITATSVQVGVDEQSGAIYVAWQNGTLHIRPEGRPLTRMIARHFDAYEMAQSGHSTATQVAGSPITDGKHIYAFFGSRGMHCLDMDGEIVFRTETAGGRIYSSPVVADLIPSSPGLEVAADLVGSRGLSVWLVGIHTLIALVWVQRGISGYTESH